MRFTMDSKTYSIWFRYDKVPKSGKMLTTCVIQTVPAGDVVSSGVTICNPCDRFDKKTGREVALFRCLKQAVKSGLTNEFWKAAMNCYMRRGTLKAKVT